jgi:hypothetical protein
LFISLALLVAIAALDEGASWISDFINADNSNLFIGYSLLGGLAFVVTFLIFTHIVPVAPVRINPPYKKTSWLGFGIVLVWGVFQLGFLFWNSLNREHHFYPLFSAVVNYNTAGLALAWASNALKTVIKP